MHEHAAYERRIKAQAKEFADRGSAPTGELNRSAHSKVGGHLRCTNMPLMNAV
jgi:hypothetical protein